MEARVVWSIQDWKHLSAHRAWYLAAYLYKYETYRCGIKIFNGNCIDIAKDMQVFKPHIVGFTAMSLRIKEAVSISLKLRQSNHDYIYPIIGGIRMSAESELTLRRGNFDVVIWEEGEQTFCDVVDAYLSLITPERLIEQVFILENLNYSRDRVLDVGTYDSVR